MDTSPKPSTATRRNLWALTCVVCALVLSSLGALVPVSASTKAHHRVVAHRLSRVTSVTFVGHGWGDGVGMGQWGAFGYAVRYHFGYERILNHFYGNSVPAAIASTGQPANPTVSVVITENMNLATNIGYDPVVTESTSYTVASQGGTPVVPATTTSTTTTAPTTTTTSTTIPATSFPVPAGTAIDLHLNTDGTWSAYEASTCAGAASAVGSTAPVATGLINPVVTPSVTPDAARANLMVLCRHDGVDESLRGSVEAYDRSGYERTLNLVPMESYLRGVVPSESSASWGNDGTLAGAPQAEPWGFQALEAQAVAARSFAMAYLEAGGWNGYAGICDAPLCEVYSGANYETAVSDASVADTAGEIRVSPGAPNAAVSTQFSASTGGFTAPSQFLAVRDLGDACVVPSDVTQCNPNHTWSTIVFGTVIARHFRSVGRVLSVHVRQRNGHGAYGGRALEVVVRGTRSVKVVPGSEFAIALGLKSDWFAIGGVTRLSSTSSSIPVPATIPTATTSSTTVTPSS